MIDLDLADESEWPTDDLIGLRTQVMVELERRTRLETLPQQAADAITAYQEAIGLGTGEAWTQPDSYLTAYRLGATVTHDGKEWVSTRDGASGEPGVDLGDWVEVVPEGEIPVWVQPMAGQEYPVGAVVSHNGHLWRNDHVGPNGWEPGVTGSQWTDLGPA